MRTTALRLAACIVLLTMPWITGCSPANQEPIADAGQDQTVDAGTLVTLNGAGSSDPEDTELTWSWVQIGGSPNVALNGPNSAAPTFTAPATAGTLTFRLTVSDGGLSDTSIVNVTVVIPNLPPVAATGPNQRVNAGATVTLNAAGSTDPEGRSLTFAWSQVPTAGAPTVLLSGANTPTPTFTAPSTPILLTFQLTVSDGNASATDNIDIGVDVPVTATPVLLVANVTGNRVLGFDAAKPANLSGNVQPTATLSGAQSKVSGPVDIAIDLNGALLVANDAGNAITVYSNAADLTGINGNVAPLRNVQGSATLLGTPTSIALLAANDLLFVADGSLNGILSYAGASTVGFVGDLAPTRTLLSPDLAGPIGIAFDGEGRLYVANSATPKISVFDGAAALSGSFAANRVITNPTFTSLSDVFVDAANRLFVVDSGRVHVFNNASGLHGEVAPNVTLTVPGAGQLRGITVGSDGTGYIADFTNNAVLSYDSIATRHGTIAPDRTLKGPNTQLAGPNRVLLYP